jgi:hypothetical protein
MVSTQRYKKCNTSADAPQPQLEKTKQSPPEPKAGSRPTVRMFASFEDKKNVLVRVFLDTGYDTPMMSKRWAETNGVPLVTRTEPKSVENFNGEIVQGAG